MDYRFIFPLLAIGFILPSFILPWVVIDFISQYSYSPLDFIIALIDQNTNNILNREKIIFDLPDMIRLYPDSYFALMFSMIIYLISLIAMIASLLTKKNSLNILLAAGIFAIISSILWIYSIESFKTHFVEDAAESGGIVGEEFKGKEDLIINNIIKIKIGNKIVIAAGVFAILAYLWPLKKEITINQISY